MTTREQNPQPASGRKGLGISSSVRNLLMLLVVTALAGSITVLPKKSTELVSGTPSGQGAGSPGEKQIGTGLAADDPAMVGVDSTSGGVGKTSGKAAATKATDNLKCAAGKNGGSTDKGVSAREIGLASTIVTSGPGSTFLGLSQYGMQAAVVKVNAAGGICGRQLKLRLVNDNWEAARGHDYLKNFINDPGVFALPVVPSSEGLRAASDDIKLAGIPVVGSDGMLIDQYQNPVIWPVAAATVSQVRIAARYAYDKGAKSFAIVYDTRYRFGVEGADAYECYVSGKSGSTSCPKRLPGDATFVTRIGIEPNQPGYGGEIKDLTDACAANSKGCEAVLMLVDPGTAGVWIKGDDKFISRAKVRMGASPLFNARFGQDCAPGCDGMVMFTGYIPALEGNSTLPGIQTYVQDVKTVQPNADTSNQFLQGSYLGMTVFVEALKKVGPNLTRARLKESMNAMSYSSDLSSPLSWTASKRFANIQAQAWELQAPSSFNGFRDLRTGWLIDPEFK